MRKAIDMNSLKETLRILLDLSGLSKNFVEFRDGKMYYLLSQEQPPDPDEIYCLDKFEPDPEAIYRLGYRCCGYENDPNPDLRCTPGHPRKTCLSKGCYGKNCAKYHLELRYESLEDMILSQKFGLTIQQIQEYEKKKHLQ